MRELCSFLQHPAVLSLSPSIVVWIRHLQGWQVSQQILLSYLVIKQGMELYKMSQRIQSPATHNSRDIFDLPVILMELARNWISSRYLRKFSQFMMSLFCPYQAKFTKKIKLYPMSYDRNFKSWSTYWHSNKASFLWKSPDL